MQNQSKSDFERPDVQVGDTHYAMMNGEYFPAIVYRTTEAHFWFSGKYKDQLMSSTMGTDKHLFRPLPEPNEYELAPLTVTYLF